MWVADKKIVNILICLKAKETFESQIALLIFDDSSKKLCKVDNFFITKWFFFHKIYVRGNSNHYAERYFSQIFLYVRALEYVLFACLPFLALAYIRYCSKRYMNTHSQKSKHKKFIPLK